MSTKKISTLIPKQVPSFINEEYPKFVSFMEAYYEFLEKEQFTSGVSQKNDVVNKSKDIRYVSDVDTSLDQFEDEFFKSFLPYLPKDTAANKDIIIKNIMPLYLSKGSMKSFRLLFRMLFDASVEISYPKDNVLRASDGRWVSENILKVSDNVYSTYTSDGVQTVYYLPEVYSLSEFGVFVNGVEAEFTHQAEYKKFTLTNTPNLGDNVRVYYYHFDQNLLASRKLIGTISGATSIVEKAGQNPTTKTLAFDIFLNKRNTVGKFLIGETIHIELISDGNIIPMYMMPFSDITSINIIDGGSSYNVGDPIIITGTCSREAIAVVDKVSSGVIDSVTLIDGGAGFKVGANIIAIGYSQESFNARVVTIDTTGSITPNTVTISSDVVGDYANVLISAADYGFPSSNALVEDANTVIADALSFLTIANLGTVTLVEVLSSSISSAFNPIINIVPETVYGNTTISGFGIVGEFGVVVGGVDYNIGDTVDFYFDPQFYGRGANGVVTVVDANGSIQTVKVVNGGLSYSKNQNNITITSANGHGAMINVASTMGDGDYILGITSNVAAGQIQSIKIIDSGLNYSNVPGIDLRSFGDGNALANSTLRDTFVELPGKWTTSDGKVSNEDVVLQGRDYFIDFSYVVKSQVEFSKYKTILKDLLHPVGFKNYAVYSMKTNIDGNSNVVVQNIEVTKQLSGTSNITNGSIVVIGTSTKFATLNVSNNIVIMIDSQTRNVVSMTSNTSLNVDIAFTKTSNNNLIKIVV